MDRNKKLILVVGGIIIVGTIALIFLLLGRERAQEPTVPEIITTTDADTGDEVITVEGKEPEFDPYTGPTIFGGAKMVDQTVMTNAQYQLVTVIMSEYASAHVGDRVAAIKFLPDTVKVTASTPAGIPYRYTMQVKTEGPTALLDVTINLIGLNRVQITVTNPNKPDVGVFDSGMRPSQEEEHFDEGL